MFDTVLFCSSFSVTLNVCTWKSKGGDVCSRSSTYMLCEHVNTLLLGVFRSRDTRLLCVTELIKLQLLRNAKATYIKTAK